MLVLVLSACREDRGVDLLAKPQLRSLIEQLWHCQAESLETILHHALENVNAEFSRPTSSRWLCRRVESKGVRFQSTRYDFDFCDVLRDFIFMFNN